MHIALISYHTCPLASYEGKESGGMNVYVLELAKELAKKGHHIDVFTRVQDQSDRIVQVSPGFQVTHLKAGPASYIAKKELIQYIDEFSQNLEKFTANRQLSYDVIHAHYYMSGLAALKLKSKKKQPLITTFHTLALMKNLVARDVLERESDERIKAEFKLIKQSDVITASSKTEKDYLMSLYDCSPSKIKIITPGVNTKLFHRIDKKEAAAYLKENPKQKIILFVGRIEPLKGIDVLMYALKIYLHNNPHSNVKLLIVGGGAELLRLKQLQHTLNIHPSVEFIPQQPQPKLPYYYNYADIVILPSHYESFGMTALEAMACGTSIITTDTSGISSILDKELKDLIISANNPLLLARQIESVFNEQKKHAKLQKKVMEKVKKMSWDHVADKVINVYNQVLSPLECYRAL